MPYLPVELIDLIFDQVILDMPISRNGTGVSAFMHACKSTRAKAFRVFESMRVLERQGSQHHLMGVADSRSAVYLDYFGQLLRALLQSFKTGALPQLPSTSDLTSTNTAPHPSSVDFELYTGISYVALRCGVDAHQIQPKTLQIVGTSYHDLSRWFRNMPTLSPTFKQFTAL